jgi:titin
MKSIRFFIPVLIFTALLFSESCEKEEKPPSNPSGLVLSVVSSTQIDLSWSDNSGNEKGFTIERAAGITSNYLHVTSLPANSTSHSDTGLQPGTTYSYRVKAFNDAGVSVPSASATATTTASGGGLTAPSGLSATGVSSSQINLSWTDNSGTETGFRIERAPGGTTSFSEIATTGSNVTSYQNTGLTASTSYSYRVKAYNATNNSDWSNTATAATQAPAATVPAAPSGLTATAVSSSQINLSWTDNAGNETGYKVQRAPGGTTSFVEIASLGAGVTSYQNTGLTASTSYAYRVLAFNGVGNSGYSNTATATTQAPAPTVPNAPTNLTATAASSSQINLSWTDNAGNETGYKVERAPGGTSSFAEIASLGANVTSYQNTGLAASTSYAYRVRAYNATGNSGYSNTATTSSLAAPPSAPTNLTATAVSTSQINLGWTDNAGNETGYKIERAPGGTTSFVEIASLSANSTSYQNTGLASATSYSYRVYAYNAAGNSNYSNTATATTTGTPPAAPSGLTAEAQSPSSVRLTWIDNSNNETGFEIQRHHTSLNTWITVTTTSANAQSYTHSGLSETWPAYRIRAVNASGSSSYSNEALPPPKLRVINNLDNRVSGLGNDWGKLNNIVRVRIGATAANVEANGNSYERLAPYDTQADVGNAQWIAPSYTSANTYKDFPVSTYSGIGSTYYLYLQCGWWEYYYPGFGSGYWIKRVSEVLCTNGTCCCYKWAYIQVQNHTSGYFVIKATEVGLVHGSWNGSLKKSAVTVPNSGGVTLGEFSSGETE